MRFRRRGKTKNREPIWWQRVCSTNWGTDLDAASEIDCESAVMDGGLVLASGFAGGFGEDIDTEVVVKKIHWPSIPQWQSRTGTNHMQGVVSIVVIKTSKGFTELNGTPWTNIIESEDVLDYKHFSFYTTVGGEMDWNAMQYANGGSGGDAPYEINVQRRLQSTEHIIALSCLTHLLNGFAAGNSIDFRMRTPLVSVLFQRALRRR